MRPSSEMSHEEAQRLLLVDDTSSRKRSQSDGLVGETIRVLTFNTWLMPFVAACCFVDTDVTKRAAKVAQFLKRHAEDCDVLLLQEVWSSSGATKLSAIVNACCCGNRLFGRQIVEQTVTEDFYVTKPTSIPACSFPSFRTFLDSGLMIASKWPIEKERFVWFSDFAGEDGMASKGVLLAYTNEIIVANTHLNAKDIHVEARRKQLAQLRLAFEEFRDDLKFDGCPINRVLMGGDWNIDGACVSKDTTEYQQLVEDMKSMGLKDSVSDARPWDQQTCTVEHYKHIGASNLSCSRAPQRLDMVFSNAVLEGIEAWWKDKSVPVLYDPDDNDCVSDHAPVLSRLRFDN